MTSKNETKEVRVNPYAHQIKKIITEELENVAKELIDQTIQKSFQKGMHLNICM